MTSYIDVAADNQQDACILMPAQYSVSNVKEVR